jgi:Na+/H+ antiporter NhaD/arsenite permease-like protein
MYGWREKGARGGFSIFLVCNIGEWFYIISNVPTMVSARYRHCQCIVYYSVFRKLVQFCLVIIFNSIDFLFL